MTNDKKHFIARYEMALQQGKNTAEFADEMGIPLSEVRWRAKHYRKSGELTGQLKRCRQGQISQNHFKQIYMQAVVDGKDMVWVASQTGQTKNGVKCQAYAIRQSGVDLPALIKSKDRRAILRDYIDGGAFI